MKNTAKILVVGTTSDYITWLQRVGEGRVLFLTDPLVRQQAKEPAPTPKEEILCNLNNVAQSGLPCWTISIDGT